MCKIMYNKTIIEFGFRMISSIIKTSCLCYLPRPSASADNIVCRCDINDTVPAIISWVL